MGQTGPRNGLCRGGISFFLVLFLLFLALKLGGYINWSWVWVTVPLWGPVAVTVGGVLLSGLLILILVAMIFGFSISLTLIDKIRKRR